MNDKLLGSEEFAAARAFKKKTETKVTKVEEAPSETKQERRDYCDGSCQKGTIVQESPASSEIKERALPIWPMSDEQLAQWHLARATKNLPRQEPPLSLEKIAELQAAGREAARRKVVRLTEEPSSRLKAEKQVSEKPEKTKTPRQRRLGQTKLIDDLLREGKSEAEILATVKEKIPQYPAEMLPKLIKLRQYHVKK